MFRSSRLALVSLMLVAATAPAVMASDNTVRTVRPPAKGEVLTVDVVAVEIHAPVAMATVLALNSFQGQTMRFEKRDTTDAVDGGLRWSPRIQASLQTSAFDHALTQTFAARDHSPGTFAGSRLDSLVDFAGPENVKNAAKSYRPKPDQYRLLLRAIRNRSS